MQGERIGKMRPVINIHPTLEELSAALVGYVVSLAAQATAARRRFCIALSGGSIIKIIAPRLIAEPPRHMSLY